jgi:hypothetical protein
VRHNRLRTRTRVQTRLRHAHLPTRTRLQTRLRHAHLGSGAELRTRPGIAGLRAGHRGQPGLRLLEAGLLAGIRKTTAGLCRSGIRRTVLPGGGLSNTGTREATARTWLGEVGCSGTTDRRSSCRAGGAGGGGLPMSAGLPWLPWLTWLTELAGSGLIESARPDLARLPRLATLTELAGPGLIELPGLP